jgi:HlyD family secretion protein
MDTSSRLDVLAGSDPVRPRESALGQEAPKKALNRKRVRLRRLAFGGVAVALVAGLSTWIVLRRGPKPTLVQMTTVGREDLQAKVTANGRVQAQKKVDLSATVAGQVTHLAVDEGDRVRKGQFLLQIDPANPRSAARSSEASMQALLREVDSARARLDQSRLDARRAEENHGAQIISNADLDQARTALVTAEAALRAAERRVEQARATLEGARDTLAKTTVLSPIDGIVTAKRVEEGEVAVIGVLNQPGTVLLTISDMSIVEAEMDVDETSIPTVKVGQQARVRIDAYPNRTFGGVVTEVGSSPIDRTASQQQNEAIKFKVKIQIRNPPDTVKPGLSVQADILTGFRSQALVVPLQALVLRDAPRPAGGKGEPGAPRDEEGVYLVENGKARFQPLETGLLGELSVEVVKGLKGGETLVSGPFRALRSLKPGDPVEPEKSKKPGGPSVTS